MEDRGRMGLSLEALEPRLLLNATVTDANILAQILPDGGTPGVAGIGDPALTRYGLQKQNEDFGQTLAVWGLEPGVYLFLPFVGPSCCRGAVGLVVDWSLDPLVYVVKPWYVRAVLGPVEGINSVSLRLGEYEHLKGMALDPYVALRDAYGQHRRHLIDE